MAERDQSERPCPLCTGDEDYAVFCEGHTESEQRLAHALAKVCQDEDTDEKARWFADDAAVVAETVAEGDGWVVEQPPDRQFLVFMVNGIPFWVDPNEAWPDERATARATLRSAITRAEDAATYGTDAR